MTTISIGKHDGGDVRLDVARLIESRLLVTATSGGGKSWLLRKILEEVSGTTQTIVIDPEAEFASLRELRDMLLVGADGEIPADPRSAGLLARRLMELRISAVIDIYELTPPARRLWVANFCNGLVNLPKDLWHPCVIAIDELHEFATSDKSKDIVSNEPVALLNSKGRKRGYAMIGATQRLGKLNMDVAAELKNRFIGQTGLDVDQKRAADFLGWGKDRWPDLRDLSPPGHEGEFFAVGPALNVRGIVKFRAGQVKTTHPKAGEGRILEPPQASKKIVAVLDGLKDLPQQADEEAKSLADAKRQIAELKRQVASKPVPPVDDKTIERAVGDALTKRDREWEARNKERDRRLGVLAGRMNKARDVLQVNGEGALPDIPEKTVNQPRKEFSAPPRPKTITKQVNDSEVGTGGLQRILTALAQRPHGLSARQVGIRAAMSSKSGTFGTYLARARTAGWIDGGKDRLTITDDGLTALGDYQPLPEGRELLEHWLRELGDSGAARMLQAIADAYPHSVSKQDLGEAAGMSSGSGTFGTYLSRLRSLELVTGRGGEIRASDELF